MPFNKGCRVTTDVKLEGYERTKGEGGWGHVVYHTYADNGIKTFTEKQDTMCSSGKLVKLGFS